MSNKFEGQQNPLNKAAIMFADSAGYAHIMNEDVCLPAIAIKKSALENNIQWMQNYANHCGISLAPHGKTTMTPAIFKMQIAGGAWGVGVGTAYQAKVAIAAGVPNIIMANQLIGRANMALVSQLKQQSSATLFCCVDSQSNALKLSEYFSAHGQTMNVLIELGLPGGRCGCRTADEAEALADYVATLPGLTLAGVEFYEGIIHSNDEQGDLARIGAFISEVIDLTQRLTKKGLFIHCDEVLLTGAGSVWYDIVCHQLMAADLPDNIRYVIRPGCYVTHDKGVYEQSQNALTARDSLAGHLEGGLVSALELCAYVQSLPEKGLAIIGFGKRDAAFDAGLPQPIAHYRQGEEQPFTANAMKTVDVMDQHAMVRYSENVQLQVGDILVFSTSHPCLTFDKWKTLFLVDDKYTVLEEMDTFF
ncbi:amino acid deaminase [Pragia fontium]|uniref:D-serine dehydratase n=1 Tax=Pragia fontium DSM 5563 = ATCC 49100 TaxID=1122977 RepID=A0AAJ4WAJ7_9GAMM|nr:amino acid deaminase [Pragia fontium]AKJ42380.1 aldolase [Pragia fontium]SFC79947.1 D-serine dehydratase [Pragia fontium DSM 5563 = ATCC 49100]